MHCSYNMGCQKYNYIQSSQINLHLCLLTLYSDGRFSRMLMCLASITGFIECPLIFQLPVGDISRGKLHKNWYNCYNYNHDGVSVEFGTGFSLPTNTVM